MTRTEIKNILDVCHDSPMQGIISTIIIVICNAVMCMNVHTKMQ